MDKFQLGFGIISILLFVFLVLFFCMLIIKLYIKKVTTHKQTLFDKEINFQKTIKTTILETQEQILKSVSDDLHDDAGQQLTVINLQLENLKLDFPDNNLQSVSESVTQLSQTIRQMSHSLSTNWLEKNGLIDAIKAEVHRIQKNKNIHFDIESTNIDSVLFSENEAIVLYRIFQEIINNILKHAKATNVLISLTANPNFELKIKDNGIGFELDTKKNQLSLGLENMIKRAEMIGYKIVFETELGKGTTVTLHKH